MANEDAQDQFFEEGDDNLCINMDEVEEQSFELLPKGEYSCAIEECEFKLSQSSGKPMWSIILVVIDGEYANRKLFYNMSFSEKALPMTKGTLKKLAPELLNSTFNPQKIASEGTLLGKECVAKVTVESYQGENRNYVKSLTGVTSGAGDEFTAA